MQRYIIQDNTTKKYLRRTSGYGGSKVNSWVASVDDATLITTGSSASLIAHNIQGSRYSKWRPAENKVTIIKVGVLIYPEGLQPFMDGVLNHG